MKVLTIIVTYNGLKWIEKCLASVESSSIHVDTIVIDNGSSDGTIEYISNNFPNVLLVATNENLGFGKGNNIGLSYALSRKYDYVYLLNQDAWVEKNTIEILINAHKKTPVYGILSPLQLSGDKAKFDSNFLLCCPKQMLSDVMCNNLKCIYDPEAQLMAAHWLVSFETISKVGGFSPSFPHYGEDHNYLHRALFFGIKSGIVPQAIAIHDREFRIEKTEVTLNKICLERICELSDPNKSFLYQTIRIPLFLIKHTFFRFGFKSVVKIINIIMSYKKIYQNRERSKNFSFLDDKLCQQYL